jgi:hypothetical protein
MKISGSGQAYEGILFLKGHPKSGLFERSGASAGILRLRPDAATPDSRLFTISPAVAVNYNQFASTQKLCATVK